MSSKWLKIILIAITVIMSGIAFYIDKKLDNNIILLNEKDRIIDSVNVQNVSLKITTNKFVNDINDLLKTIAKLKSTPLESSLVVFDSIVITYQDSIRFRDSIVITHIIDSTKPTWGSIHFSDSSNFYTNVGVNVEWPYGKRQLTYEDKYKVRKFIPYIGIGYNDKNILVSGDIFYKKIGLGVTVGKTNTFFIKYSTFK